jgi:MFS family permease
MISFLKLEHSIAKPGYDRRRVLPVAMALHLCLGQAYALGALYQPLMTSTATDQTGAPAWINLHLNGVFTLAMVILGLSAAFAGPLVVRIGPRATALLSTLLFCCGLALAGIAIEAEQTLLFYASYGVIAGIGLGIGYVAPVQMLLDWFPERRGLATGLAITGFGGGAMLATALSSFLMEMFRSLGWNGAGQTLITLAAVYGVIMLVASLAIRVPAGAASRAVPSVEPSRAVRKPQFYLLWIILLISVVAGINHLASAPGILTLAMGRSASMAEISGFVALLSVSNMAGRFLAALASDYLGRKNTAGLLLITGAVLYASTPLIAARMNLPFTVLEYMLMTAVYGGLFAIMPSYVSDVFGPKYAGFIHGRILTAWSAGAAIAFALGALFTSDPAASAAQQVSRSEAFYGTALLFLLALAINFLIRPAVHQPAADLAKPEYPEGEPPVDVFALMRAWWLVSLLLLTGVLWTIYKASGLPLAWEIGVTLVPLGLGAMVCVAFHFLDRSRFTVRGVVGPYFAALALLFGLYASLMANEVWQKTTRINDLLDAEVSALQSLSLIAVSVMPGDPRVPQAIQAYADALVAIDRMGSPDPGAPSTLQEPLQRLYLAGADAEFFKGHSSQNASFMTALENLRTSNLQRSKLRSQPHDGAKLASLLIFGLLTQIAIAFCHAGNPRALSTSVMLFSAGFSVAVAVMELLDTAIRFADTAGVIPYLWLR